MCVSPLSKANMLALNTSFDEDTVPTMSPILKLVLPVRRPTSCNTKS